MGTSKLGISSSAAVTAAAFMLASSASAAQDNDYHDFIRSLPSPAEFIEDQDIEYSSETMEWIEDVGNDVKVIESGSEDYERFCEIRASVCNSVALFLTPVPIYSLGPSPDDVANGEDIHFIVSCTKHQTEFPQQRNHKSTDVRKTVPRDRSFVLVLVQIPTPLYFSRI